MHSINTIIGLNRAATESSTPQVNAESPRDFGPIQVGDLVWHRYRKRFARVDIISPRPLGGVTLGVRSGQYGTGEPLWFNGDSVDVVARDGFRFQDTATRTRRVE